MRQLIGTVAELWRYPVKSMGGEKVDEITLTEHGAVGDRVYALRELKYGGIMSARLFAAMLQLSAVCERPPASGISPRVRIDLPDGRAIHAEDRDASDALSDFFQFSVRLERPREAPLTMEEIEAIREGRAFLPPRDLYDEDVLHVLASGTLAHLRRLQPGSDFDVRRFRPNVYVDTGERSGGFIEDRWLGGELEIRPARRCAMTIHPQTHLPADPATLRTAAQHHGAYVGAFAAVGLPGRIRCSDQVRLMVS
jgi:uncharacterized protein